MTEAVAGDIPKAQLVSAAWAVGAVGTKDANRTAIESRRLTSPFMFLSITRIEFYHKVLLRDDCKLGEELAPVIA